MIKKEWSWMLNLPIDNNDDEDVEELIEDGIDDFISTPKETPYNDDDYDH
jgi:hypothetical protein